MAAGKGFGVDGADIRVSRGEGAECVGSLLEVVVGFRLTDVNQNADDAIKKANRFNEKPKGTCVNETSSRDPCVSKTMQRSAVTRGNSPIGP